MKKKKNKSENVLSRPQVDSVIALYTHGNFEEAIDAIKDLNEKYPNDLATGYSANQLRGIWVVEMN